MNIDKHKLLSSLGIIVVIFIIVGTLTHISHKNSLTLSEYAQTNPDSDIHTSTNSVSPGNDSSDSDSEADSSQNETIETNDTMSESDVALSDANEILQNESEEFVSTLTGALLNGISELDKRWVYADNFYYEPISENLKRYITGVSFPAPSSEQASSDSIISGDIDDDSNTVPSQIKENNDESTIISIDDLCYAHIMHYDFDGNLAEGELICNELIARDIVEIFYELYKNEYKIEKVLLIDEYDGDDTASMEDNNTSCFNYRTVAGSNTLSKHALGLAIDINPLYNPYITYNADGTENVLPESAIAYADRTLSFPYKIDENDLCYKLFTEHGFVWGGNWNSCKDYQHFQKNP